jgi:hypothetical protein
VIQQIRNDCLKTCTTNSIALPSTLLACIVSCVSLSSIHPFVSGSGIYRTGPGLGCPTGSATRTYGACNSDGITRIGITRGADGVLQFNPAGNKSVGLTGQTSRNPNGILN